MVRGGLDLTSLRHNWAERPKHLY